MADTTGGPITSFGGALGIIQGILSNPVTDAIGSMATWGTKLGQFFGIVNPETASITDILDTARKYAAHKTTAADLGDHAVTDFINFAGTNMLESMGWPAPIATLVTGIVANLAKNLLHPITAMVAGGTGTVLGGAIKNVGGMLHIPGIDNAVPGFTPAAPQSVTQPTVPGQ